MKRLTNNSKSIQKAFPGVYRDFFSKCAVVTSAPGSFFISGEHLVLYGGIAIKQKLPTNIYVGLQNAAPDKFEIVSAKYLDFTKKWESLNEKNIFEKISRLVTDELKKNGLHSGFYCHILSEVPPGCGLATSGALGAALAGALLTANKIISTQDIQTFKKLKSQELIKNEKFNKLFRLAWKIDSVIQSGISSGVGPFCSLAWTNYPIVFFAEKRKVGRTNNGGTPVLIDEKNDFIDKINFFGFYLNHLLGIEQEINWPIDFGLIYTGNAKSSGLIIGESQSVRDLIQKTVHFGRNLFKDQLITHKDKILFYDPLFKNGSDGSWKNFLNFANEISLECLFSLSHLLDHRYDDSIMYNFFRSVNRYHNILQFLRVSSPAINRVRSHINYCANQTDPKLGGAAKLTGPGKGGDVLFVVPEGHFRDSTNDIIRFLRKDLGREIWLDYASWIDGTEVNGLEICQNLEEKIYSVFISRGAVILDIFQNNKVHSEIIGFNEFEKRKNLIDILLDPLNNDIYIGSQLLNSEQLHSAKATIKFLCKILEENRNFSNNELGSSSYLSDRNEFQSKIISPLKKALKKYRQKDLGLKIKGGITNFLIEANINHLVISIIRNTT